jgi:hypothetical protein
MTLKYKISEKRKIKNTKNAKTRKFKGGTNPNIPINFCDIPSDKYYPYNNTGGMPNPVDARVLMGGGKKTKRKSKKMVKKMKGGALSLSPFFPSSALANTTDIPGYGAALNTRNLLSGSAPVGGQPGMSYKPLVNTLV